ncbi:preprotein translocase subunit SecG [Lysobacter sp. SG-8]|uniref:Protein-export membrane protein SecG n=1 Tax=Marilutibacter penaei TaxID=2759900 RepID=A0A7W3YD75_9GAMM|nr:preprotein translocase subunit SecG [Lysobacter penaei]MBB1087479.1 preprotein translocase subunit SecG [Lysobacter penaei]
MLLLLNVIFVLVAIAMIALILMQRGAGAAAGSGFGAGASATVFGARGSSNFLSKATKWLAIAFFAITFYMAWQATHGARPAADAGTDLGVMGEVPQASGATMQGAPEVPPAASEPVVPQAQPAEVPVAPPEPPAEGG